MARATTTLSLPTNLSSLVVNSAAVRLQMQRVTDEVADRARDVTPVGSGEHLPKGHEPGALKASERPTVEQTLTGPVGVISYGAFWARFVHNGTVHAHPNPWLLNAALSVLHRAQETT